MTVFAIHAHPDDIEIHMAGTLLLLKETGCRVHYMNIANGCVGSTTMSREEITKMRAREAQEAAAMLGAEWHPSICDDLDILYAQPNIRRLTAEIRKVAPDMLFIASPQDYMEDHTAACRLAASAAFIMGAPLYESEPPVPAVEIM
jgi:LmbE family N-acetylglucosaminyl deacetylase